MTQEKIKKILSIHKELETLKKIKKEIERDFSHNSSCDCRLMYTLQSCTDFHHYWPLLEVDCESFNRIMNKHNSMIIDEVNECIDEFQKELEKM